MRLDQLIQDHHEGSITKGRYQRNRQEIRPVTIWYDCKTEEWDFSELDRMNKAEAERWLRSSQLITRYEEANGVESFFPTVFVIYVVHTMEYAEWMEHNRPPWPSHLASYRLYTDLVAEAYLIYKFTLDVEV